MSAVVPAAPDGRLAGLVERLRAAGRRQRARRLFGAVTLAATAGLAALVVGLLLEWLQPVTGWALHTGIVLGVAAGVFAAVLLVAVAVVMSRRPDIDALARAADRRFALDERLSTALEVAGSPQQEGLVADVLVADAGRRSRAVEPGALLPWRWPRLLAAVPVLALIAVGITLLPPITRQETVATSPGAAPTALQAEERTQAASNIRRIAALVRADAERRGDTYLGAVAQTLERVGGDIESGAVDRAAVTRELAELLSHAERAYTAGEARGVPHSDVPGLLQQALAQLDAPQAPRTPSAPAQVASEKPGDQQQTPNAPAGEGDANAAISQRLAAAEAAEERRRQTNVQPDREVQNGEVRTRGGGYEQRVLTPQEEREQQLLDQRLQQAGAQPAGAAENAGRGESELAGGGEQPLEGDEHSASETPDNSEMVLLPDQNRDSGPRVIQPAPVELNRTAIEDRGVRGDWQRQPPAAGDLDRVALPRTARAVVSRYFAGASEETAP